MNSYGINNILLPLQGEFQMKYARSLKKVVEEIIDNLHRLYFPEEELSFWMYHSYDLHLYNYFPLSSLPVDRITHEAKKILEDKNFWHLFGGYSDYIKKNNSDPHDINNYRLLQHILTEDIPGLNKTSAEKIIRNNLMYLPFKCDGNSIFKKVLDSRKGIWYSKFNSKNTEDSGTDAETEKFIGKLLEKFKLIPEKGYCTPLICFGQVMGFIILEMKEEKKEKISLLENYLLSMSSQVERAREMKFIREVILDISENPHKNLNEIILNNIHFAQNIVLGILAQKKDGKYRLTALRKFNKASPLPYLENVDFEKEKVLFDFLEKKIWDYSEKYFSSRNSGFLLDRADENDLPEKLLKDYAELPVKPLSKLSILFPSGSEEYLLYFYYAERPEYLNDNLNNILRILSHVYILYELQQELVDKARKAEWEQLAAGISHTLTKITAIARGPLGSMKPEDLLKKNDLKERIFQTQFYLEKLRKRINFIHKASGRRFKQEEFEKINIWKEAVSSFKDAWVYHLTEGNLKKYEIYEEGEKGFSILVPPVLKYNGFEYIFYDEVNMEYLKEKFPGAVFMEREKPLPPGLFEEKPLFMLPAGVFSTVFEEIFINVLNYSEREEGFVRAELTVKVSEKGNVCMEIKNRGREYDFFLSSTGVGWGLYVIKYFFEEILKGHIEKTYSGGKNVLKLTFEPEKFKT